MPSKCGAHIHADGGGQWNPAQNGDGGGLGARNAQHLLKVLVKREGPVSPCPDRLKKKKKKAFSRGAPFPLRGVTQVPSKLSVF